MDRRLIAEFLTSSEAVADRPVRPIREAGQMVDQLLVASWHRHVVPSDVNDGGPTSE